MTESPKPEHTASLAEAPTLPIDAVPTDLVTAAPAPRRRRTGPIVMSVLNTLLLLALGGVVALMVRTDRAWQADREYKDRQIAEIVAEVAEADSQISDLDAEIAELGQQRAEVERRDPAVLKCVAAVRKTIERIDAGERSIVLDYDDPCGVPLSTRWTING